MSLINRFGKSVSIKALNVDWNHPLAKCISTLIINGVCYDGKTKTKKLTTTSGTINKTATPHGIATQASANGATSTVIGNVPGQNLENLTDFVIIEGFHAAVGSLTAYVCGTFDGTNGTGITIENSGFSNNWGVYESGNVYSANETPSDALNGICILLHTRDNTNHKLYRNGTLRNTIAGTNATAAPTIAWAQNNLMSSGSGSYSSNDKILMSGRFNRDLTAAEVLSFSSNPWQIFKPIRRSVISYLAASGVSVNLTGLSSTSYNGSLSLGIDKTLTGTSSTSAKGSVVPDLSKAITGQQSTNSQGTLSVSIDKTLTGQQGTLSQGTISPSLTTVLTGLSSSSYLGILTPQIDNSVTLSGLSFTASQGSLSVDISKILTGQYGTLSYGTLSPELTKSLDGISSTLSGGTLTPQSAGNITLVGLSMTTAQGVLGAGISKTLTGQELSALQGSFYNLVDITLTLTGYAITSHLGSLAVDQAVIIDVGNQTIILCENGTRVYLVDSVVKDYLVESAKIMLK